MSQQPNWGACPEATHYSPALEPNDIWCAVFWRMVDGKAVAAWRVRDDGSVGPMISKPSLLEDTRSRMIERPVSKVVIDWSDAPEGATHALPREGYKTAWFMQTHQAFEWVAGEWHGIGADLGEHLWAGNLIERPAPEATCAPVAPQWDGSGLPPVGATCERAFSYSTWKATSICGHSTDGAYAAFYDGDGLMGWADSCKLRTIRTPEQIAEQIAEIERENAIAEIANIGGYGRLGVECAARLYDAGYCRAPGYAELIACLDAVTYAVEFEDGNLYRRIKAALSVARGEA